MSELALIISLTTVLLALFVVLTERKFLAYAQRRMGPAVMGRNGALQIALQNNTRNHKHKEPWPVPNKQPINLLGEKPHACI